MAGAQREVTGRRPAEPDTAFSWLRVSLFALLVGSLTSLPSTWAEQGVSESDERSVARQRPTRRTTPVVEEPPAVRRKLPRPAEGATRKSWRRGKTKDEEAATSPEDHGLAPVTPARFVPKLAPTLVAPPERLVRPWLPLDELATSQEKPVEPPAKPAVSRAPTFEPLDGSAAPLDGAATPQDGATVRQMLLLVPSGETGAPVKPAEPEPAAPRARAQSQPKAAPAAMAASSTLQEDALPPTKEKPARRLSKRGRARRRHAAPASSVEPSPPPLVLDQAVFDKIRLEIKRRLPYFQACAAAARRRGSPDLRRVQATWCVSADGIIKELKLEGIPDPQLATCITRMGSQPFDVKPGAELTIPTPIVFVR